MPYAGVSYGTVLVCKNDSVGVGRRSYGVVALTTLVTALHCGEGKVCDGEGVCSNNAACCCVTALEREGCACTLCNGELNAILSCYEGYYLTVNGNVACNLRCDGTGESIGLAYLVCGVLVECLIAEPASRGRTGIGEGRLVSCCVVSGSTGGYVRAAPVLVVPEVPYAWITGCNGLFAECDVIGVILYGRSSLTGECHTRKGDICAVCVACASCRVNEYYKIGNCATVGVLVIADNESYALTCGYGYGRAAPLHVGPNVTACCSGIKNGVVANLGSTLNINTNTGVCRAVVGNGNGEGVMSCSVRSYVASCTGIGITQAVVLNVVTGCLVERSVGYPELKLETVVLCGRCYGGIYGRIVGIFGLLGNLDLAKLCKLDLAYGNIACVYRAVILRGVGHKLKKLNLTVEADNDLIGLACCKIEEGAAPYEVGICNLAVYGSRLVGGHILCACLNESTVDHVNTEANGILAVVGNNEVEIVLICRSLGNIHLNVLIVTAAYCGIGNVGGSTLCGNGIKLGGCEAGSDCVDCRPINSLDLLGRLLGGIKGCALCAGCHPLVLCTLILGVACVKTHPTNCSLIAAPIVGEHSTGSLGDLLNDSEVAGLLYGGVGGYLVYGLAVNEPGNRGLGPAVAVGVEVLGGIKAKLVHILVSALAVNEEVELYVGGVLTKELNVDLVVGISYGKALTVLIKQVLAVLVKNELGVVGTRAGEECAGSTGISGGLHGNLVITVVIVILSTCLTCGVAVLYLGVIDPGGSLLLGDTKSHNAVAVEDVMLLPDNVEDVTVRPSVGLKEHVGVCSVSKVDDLLCLKGCVGKLDLGVDDVLNKINNADNEPAAAKRQYSHEKQCNYD